MRPHWVANGPLKHQKPHFSPRTTEVSPRSGWAGRLPRGLQNHQKSSPEAQKPFIFKGIPRILWSGGPFFPQFSLTHSFKHSNEAFKATFCAQKTHVFIGSVLTRSSVVTQCRTACNVELLAMSNYLQCLLAMSNCLQCRTSCNVELLAVCACNVELLAMSNYLQCRPACNVELLAMLN